jgi:polyisoprenoid-binding protein YceI
MHCFRSSLAVAFAVAVCGAAQPAAAHRQIDPTTSAITVHVKKTGLFRAFADDHEVRAPIRSGTVDDGPNASVDVVIDASELRVLDPGLSDTDRQQVQERMLGPQALDVAHYPQIHFQSTSVERAADGWRVTGPLALHGAVRSIVVAVRNERGHYRGTALFRQTNFGITPVSVAGGTVKVKDEVSIDFDITMRSVHP